MWDTSNSSKTDYIESVFYIQPDSHKSDKTQNCRNYANLGKETYYYCNGTFGSDQNELKQLMGGYGPGNNEDSPVYDTDV